MTLLNIFNNKNIYSYTAAISWGNNIFANCGYRLKIIHIFIEYILKVFFTYICICSFVYEQGTTAELEKVNSNLTEKETTLTVISFFIIINLKNARSKLKCIKLQQMTHDPLPSLNVNLPEQKI